MKSVYEVAEICICQASGKVIYCTSGLGLHSLHCITQCLAVGHHLVKQGSGTHSHTKEST
nr:MAG TPA: hypothetical protein [Caudoviricetes sp.]